MRKLSILFLMAGLLLPIYRAAAQEEDSCAGWAALDVWARPSTPAGMSAAYGYVVNLGHEDDVLLGASSDAAEAVEIHTMTIGEDDVMTMQPVEDGLHLPARGFVQLKPGDYHLMLINLTAALEIGQTFEIDLNFENAGTLTITALVADPEAMPMHEHSMASKEAMHETMPAALGLNTFATEGCNSVMMVGGWARPNLGLLPAFHSR